MTWGAAQLGIGAGRARRRRRRAARGRPGARRARRGLGRRRGRRRDRRARGRTAPRRARRIGVCVEGRDRDAAARARRASATRCATRSTAATSEDRGDRDAALRLPARPAAASPPGIPSRARTRRRPSRSCAPTTASRAMRAATRCPTASCSSGCSSASTRVRTEVVRELVRDRRLPRRPDVDRRGRGLGSRRPRARTSRCGGCSAAARSGSLAYASSGELVAPEERARRCVALRDAGVRAVKLRLHRRLARRPRASSRRCATRSAPGSSCMVDANQGWRMPGDLAPRWDVATAAQLRGSSSGSASTGWRSRCRPTTSTATRALRGRTDLRIAAGEMVRAAARGARSRRSAAAST